MPMIFQLHQPYALNEKGKRSNNEDSIFPKKGLATMQDRVFVVCDGVGGQAKGEIASKIASEMFGETLRQTRASEQHTLEAVLQQVEDELYHFTNAHTESLGMATTLTLVHFHDNGVSVAHVGDSRIYQIRNGQILYKSTDHSFVNELVQAGVITNEQAATHPQRNVITRAIQGSEKRTTPDVFILQNIAPNDYFFLCSDGILESVNDTTLLNILNTPIDNKDKIDEIYRLCEGNSRDNYSCYLIQVADCEGTIDNVYEQPTAFVTPLENSAQATATRPYQDEYEPPTGFHPKYVPPAQMIPEPPQPSYPPQNVVENIPVLNTPTAAISAQSKSSSKWIASSLVFIAIAGGGTWYFLQQNTQNTIPQPVIESKVIDVTEQPIKMDTLKAEIPITPSVDSINTSTSPNISHETDKNEVFHKKEKVKNHSNTKLKEEKPITKAEQPPKEIKLEEKKEPNQQNDEKDEPLGSHNNHIKSDSQNTQTITKKTSQIISKKGN